MLNVISLYLKQLRAIEQNNINDNKKSVERNINSTDNFYSLEYIKQYVEYLDTNNTIVRKAINNNICVYKPSLLLI